MRVRKMFIGLCIVLLVMTMPCAFAGEMAQQLTAESTLEQIIDRGVLRVGMDTFVPWAMKDKTGKFIGFEIDVATRLAEDMGVKIEFVPTAWKGILPALQAGKFDLLIGGMGIRADRALQVNFSIPYYFSGQSLVASRKLAKGLTSLEAFNNPDVTLAARTGSTSHKAALRFFPEAKLKLFDKEPQALQELYTGRAHAFISSAPLPAQEAVKHPDTLFLPFQTTFTKEPNGIALRKGDVDTLNFINSWIRMVQGEGWIEERRQYWFNTMDWEKQIR